MDFVSEKLYNGYLRRNLPTIIRTVKPMEIMMHLPCLTGHDRENIEAKTETRGKYDGMQCLLDCLKRREHWPEQFIEALEACEHTAIAAEVRAEYNALKGQNNSNPGSPPATVVRAHVHPAPSASHLPVPESQPTPAEAPPAPTEPVAQAPPPVETPVQLQEPQSADEQVPKAESQPEPVSEPPQSAPIEVAPPPPPATPPPSPVNSRTQEAAEPLPQTEADSRQEPEENSESDIRDISGEDGGALPEPANSETTQHPVEHNETDPLPEPDVLPSPEPKRSPSPVEIDTEVTEESSVAVLTPVKLPVQDTTPPIDKVTTGVPEPEETPEPPAEQVVEISHEKGTTAATSPEPEAAAAAGLDVSPNEDNDVCLSKPSDLVSMAPQNHCCPATLTPSSPSAPYSGNSDRLEISEAEPEAVTAAVTCGAVTDTVTAVACQENGVGPNHTKLEENHYESPIFSLGSEEVLVNLVHVSEEPSILNLEGQTSESPTQITNGEVAKEAAVTPPAEEAQSHLKSSESCSPSEPPPADASSQMETPLKPEERAALQTLPAQSSNTKYYLAAAGVGACALLAAWRFKN